MKVQKRPVSDAVRNLVVDKSDFDFALQKLIATPPIRLADTAKRKPRATRKASRYSR